MRAVLERQNMEGNLIFCDDVLVNLTAYIECVKPKLEKEEKKLLC